MNKKSKHFIRKLLSITQILPFFLLNHKTSYLKNEGWQKSTIANSSIDINGESIPWYSYPCLDFLKSRIKNNMSIFEYGSGNSTIWWSKFSKNVIACEHDKLWIEKIKPLPTNVKIIHQNLDESYSETILRYNNYFDIIIIDGRKRNECMKNCIHALKKNGIIILDDSNREKYEEGCSYLKSIDFKRLDFWGMKTIQPNKSCTTIFYKQDNIFGI